MKIISKKKKERKKWAELMEQWFFFSSLFDVSSLPYISKDRFIAVQFMQSVDEGDRQLFQPPPCKSPLTNPMGRSSLPPIRNVTYYQIRLLALLPY